jgi:histidine triad (HIT) family protein
MKRSLRALLIGLMVSGPLISTTLSIGASAATASTVGIAAPPVDADWGPAYDAQNPFARIIRGEADAQKVYEDAHVLAFLSLDQDAPGHVLVISKTSRARNILEMAPQDLVRIMLVAQRIAKAERIALATDGTILRQNNGTAQTVFHLHVHVIPCWSGKPPRFAQDAQGQLDRKALAAKIASAMR